MQHRGTRIWGCGLACRRHKHPELGAPTTQKGPCVASPPLRRRWIRPPVSRVAAHRGKRAPAAVAPPLGPTAGSADRPPRSFPPPLLRRRWIRPPVVQVAAHRGKRAAATAPPLDPTAGSAGRPPRSFPPPPLRRRWIRPPAAQVAAHRGKRAASCRAHPPVESNRPRPPLAGKSSRRAPSAL
jgi:hypothetical protein